MIRRNPTLAQQAALQITDGIRSGALAGTDGLLPSEAALSLRLGVSRATLREALSQLEQGGMIVRRHGIGTFVHPNQPLMEFGLEELESIETLARRTGVEIHMGDCEIRRRGATQVEAEALRLEPGTPVHAFRRVMMSGERPIAFLTDVVPVDVLEAEEPCESFKGWVLDLLLGRGQPPLKHSLTEVGARAADAVLAHWLNVPVGEPLLTFTAVLSSTDGRAVDYSLSDFIPGQFRFHIVRRVTQVGQLDSAVQPVNAGSGSDDQAAAPNLHTGNHLIA